MLGPVFSFYLSIFQTFAQPAAATPAPAKPAAATPAAPAAPAAPAKVVAPAEIVDGIQKYYKSTRKLQANFRQRYTNQVKGTTAQSDGMLFIETPGKMRWDYLTPDKTLYISDGSTLWIYEERNRQAFKQSLAGTLLPVAVTFLSGQGNLNTDFTASPGPTTYGSPGDLVVTLTPRQPSAQYKMLHFVVDAADFHVKESIIIEATGNVNRFTFTMLKQNAAATKVSAAMFRFKPPAGTNVIDAPAAGGAAPGAPQPGTTVKPAPAPAKP
jgi:outer membrane lipoprotein carrier protein